MSDRTPLDATRHSSAVIVDIDGTLCDVRGIRHFVDGDTEGKRRRDFDRFHAESIKCPAFHDVVTLVSRAKANGLAILVVTGREERWSFLTSTWLAEHQVEYDELFMRSAKDYRPDHVIKAEMLHAIVDSYRPVLAVDDREDIAEVWASAGIPTAIVGEDGQVAKPCLGSVSVDVQFIDNPLSAAPITSYVSGAH